MRAITFMRYVYANQNYETKKKLSFEIFPNMQFFIKRCLTDFQKLRLDDNERKTRALEQADRVNEMGRYAEKVLLSLHCDTKEADDYVKSLIHEYSPNKLGTEQTFFFTDFFASRGEVAKRDGIRDRKVYKYALQRKMKFQCLLSRMQARSNDLYDKAKLDHEINLYGRKYIDDKEGHEPAKKLLKEVLPNFLRGDRRTIVVSGRTGSGKTHLMKRFEREQWASYQSGISKYIPICIRLKEIRKPSKCIEEFIDKINEVDESGYDSDEKEDKSLRRFKKELLTENSTRESE
jgi:hypothetical protein